jgi:HK97 family phage major capsid protein
MAVTKQVEETRERFRAKQDELAQVLEVAKDGDRYDFAKKGVLEKLEVKDKASALERVKAMNVEIDELAEELSQTEVKAVEAAIQERDRARRTPIRGGDHVNPLPEDARVKTLGERFIATKEFKAFQDTRQPQNAMVEYSVKTLFQTSAGFAPESTRSGLVTPHIMFQHAEITDLIPVFSINQNSFKYMEETTRTHAAAERAEAQQYPESTFVFTERESAVRKIADSIPVTDEQLADESQVASLLDSRLRFGIRRRLALQVLAGNGNAPNLEGILEKSIQAQAQGDDDIMSAAYKAITKVRFTGQAEPNAFVFHPNDWQDVVLKQRGSADAAFIWGHPSMVPVTTLWGLPVALSTALTEGTVLVGDWANFSRLDERAGVEVEVGYIDKQFVEGTRTLRAQMRAAFTVTRPFAFCEIDLGAS